MGRLTAKKLNKYELQLQQQIDKIMYDADVKFPVFLPIFRDNLPVDRKSQEYKNIHKSVYIKHLRANYSLDEIVKMIDVLGFKIKFSISNKEIKPIKFIVDDFKIKYTDLMIMCEALGINIEWVKSCNRRHEKIQSINEINP